MKITTDTTIIIESTDLWIIRSFCLGVRIPPVTWMFVFLFTIILLWQSSHADEIHFFLYFLWVRWDWVHSVRRSLTGLLWQPRMIYDECGAVGGVRISRETNMLGENLPQCHFVPHDLTWARTWAAAVGSQWLTAWAIARPQMRYLRLGK
jgi:hypothetical protein